MNSSNNYSKIRPDGSLLTRRQFFCYVVTVDALARSHKLPILQTRLFHFVQDGASNRTTFLHHVIQITTRHNTQQFSTFKIFTYLQLQLLPYIIIQILWRTFFPSTNTDCALLSHQLFWMKNCTVIISCLGSCSL